MKYLVCFLALLLFATNYVHAQEVTVIKFSELKKIINNESSTEIKVINFWATWCMPCVKELPDFEEFNKQYKKSGVKVYLVSLDDVENLQSVVVPFVRKKMLESTVVLLDEPDFNSWISQIDEAWSGAIPATLFIKGKKSHFFERPLTKTDLENIFHDF